MQASSAPSGAWLCFRLTCHEKRVAVVEVSCNDTAREHCDDVVGEQLPDVTWSPYVVVAGSADCRDVSVNRESAVEQRPVTSGSAYLRPLILKSIAIQCLKKTTFEHIYFINKFQPFARRTTHWKKTRAGRLTSICDLGFSILCDVIRSVVWFGVTYHSSEFSFFCNVLITTITSNVGLFFGLEIGIHRLTDANQHFGRVTN